MADLILGARPGQFPFGFVLYDSQNCIFLMNYFFLSENSSHPTLSQMFIVLRIYHASYFWPWISHVVQEKNTSQGYIKLPPLLENRDQEVKRVSSPQLPSVGFGWIHSLFLLFFPVSLKDNLPNWYFFPWHVFVHVSQTTSAVVLKHYYL